MPDAPPPLKPAHHLILLLLAEKPSYGVALLQGIEERSGGAIRLNAGSLYRIIASLVEDELVEPLAEASRPDGAGAPRKLYSATEAGRKALRDEARRQAGLLEAARALGLAGEAP